MTDFESNKIICGDVKVILPQIPAETFNCIITSPPYWGLRAYKTTPVIWGGQKKCLHKWQATPPRRQRGEKDVINTKSIQAGDKGCCYEAQGGQFCSLCSAWRGELGLEPTIELYIEHLMIVFGELKRVLRKDGVCFVNIGDTYNSHAGDPFKVGGLEGKRVRKLGKLQPYTKTPKAKGRLPDKTLCNIPEKFSIAMEKQGWIKRCNIIWAKGFSFANNLCPQCGLEVQYSGSCMPDSAKDRPNKNGYETVYMFVKSKDTLFWTHKNTTACVGKQPLGTKGIEGEDWEWIEHSACKGKGCDKKRCVNGQVKSSLWEGHDYFYEQQYEEAQELNAERPRMGQGNQTKYHSKRGYGGGGSSFLGHSGNYNADGKLIGTKLPRYQRGPKSEHFGFKQDISTPMGRTIRNVWAINPQAFSDAHFATFPEELVEKCLKMGCPEFVCKKCGKPRSKIYSFEREYETSMRKDCDDVNYAGQRWNTTKTEIGLTDCGCGEKFVPGLVLDPFAGSCTTAVVAYKLKRNYTMIELSEEYVKMGEARLKKEKEQFSLIEG